ncbi:hypothetical protein BJ878DRAFT_518465 [Calycina marina]|uniref:Uncharacterized protein n=1 Tax=Calycina marina TaxID=1763456 RepID=A0A9P7YYS4_9HELO|nr:hypothetical protein BJ878DRAFT_518465 [Calycina marina]
MRNIRTLQSTDLLQYSTYTFYQMYLVSEQELYDFYSDAVLLLIYSMRTHRKRVFSRIVQIQLIRSPKVSISHTSLDKHYGLWVIARSTPWPTLTRSILAVFRPGIELGRQNYGAGTRANVVLLSLALCLLVSIYFLSSSERFPRRRSSPVPLYLLPIQALCNVVVRDPAHISLALTF